MAEETTSKLLGDSALPEKPAADAAPSPAAAEALKIAPQAVKRSMPMGLSIAVGILLAGIVGWLAHYLVWFILVLYLSFVAATIMEAPVKWLKRRGLRRGFAAVIVMASAMLLAFLVLWFLTSGVYNQATAVSSNLERAPDRINTFVNGVVHHLTGQSKASAWSPPGAKSAASTPAAAPVSAPTTQPDVTSQPAAAATAPGVEEFNIARSIGNNISLGSVWSNAMLGVETISWLVIMFFIVLYMLVDGADHLTGLRMLLPKGSRLEATKFFNEIAQAHRGWALASLSNVLSASTLIGSGLWLLGIPGALLLGFVAGLGELIPNIGPILGAMPAILLTLLMEPDKFFWVLGMFVVAQTIQSYTISPMMLKFSIELPVLVTIISVLVFGLLFGFLGIMVAIPLVADMVVIWQYVNRHMEKDTTDYDMVNATTGVRTPMSPDNSSAGRLRRLFRREIGRPDANDRPPTATAAEGMARLEASERKAAEAAKVPNAKRGDPT